MATFLLDSDILIYFLKGRGDVVAKVLAHPPEDLVTSRINFTELLYGTYNSAKVEKNLKVITSFLESFDILEFDARSAAIFAKEKARLKKNGTILADMDLIRLYRYSQRSDTCQQQHETLPTHKRSQT